MLSARLRKMRFPAKRYLEHYYTEIGDENQSLISFYAQIRDRIPENANHLEIGSGPTIYQVISIAPRVKQMTFTDISSGALNQVRLWRKNVRSGFSWNIFTRRSLEEEGDKPSPSLIEKREELVRTKIKRLVQVNLSSSVEFQKICDKYGPFDSIASNFAFEAIVTKRQDFRKLLKLVYKNLSSNGVFNIIMVEDCPSYQIGKKYLKTLNINREALLSELQKVGFNLTKSVKRFQATENIEYGYTGVMLLSCKK
jgi:hypothetical protein